MNKTIKILAQLVGGTVDNSEETRTEIVRTAFTARELLSRPPEDMMDSTITQLLNKCINQDVDEKALHGRRTSHTVTEGRETPKQHNNTSFKILRNRS